jgi:hypothetical protein
VGVGLAATLFGLSAPSDTSAQETTTPDSVVSDAAPQEADSGSKWFPGSFAIAPLQAAPREVRLGGGFIATSRDSEPREDYEGTNIEAQVAIGYRIPVHQFQAEGPGRPHLVIGFEVGAFTRFTMSEGQRDVIDADYKVGIPFSLKYRGWGGRVAINHQSAHYGDEFVVRFSRVPLEQVSYEGLELLVTRDIGRPVRLYVGGQLNTHSTTLAEAWVARFGVEWDPGLYNGKSIQPFAAADFEINEKSNRIAGRGVAGALFQIEQVLLRLELEGHVGPSEMGRFRDINESYIGLYLRVLI